MFWKKKKPVTEILLDDTDELRNTFRYDFKADRGLVIRFKGMDVRIKDISAEGLSFENQGFNPHDTDTVGITLNIPNFKGNTFFSAGLKILAIDKDHICHCIFEHSSPEQAELLHKYVLEMQKNDLAH